jgi:DNA-binding FadR family transcriptional regulator
MFEPVRTRHTFEEAAEQIAGKVRSGELRQGDKLPAERDLAVLMQISRPTLREAVRLLAEAGVVEVRRGPGGGIFVAGDVVPVELVRERSSLRLEEVADVLEARRLVEPGVVRLAAQRATGEHLDALQGTIDAMRVIVERGYEVALHEERFLTLDMQFHLTLARAAGNPTVEQLMRSLLRQVEIARDMAMHLPLVPEWTMAIHQRTLDAVRAGDLEEVSAAMDEHLGQLERTAESGGKVI